MMFFNFLFRVILVRFADRGLVANGKPNLALFCIGKFRRNLINLEDNSIYITCWALYACMDRLLLLLAMTTNSPLFAPQHFFFLYNLVSFLFIDILHGIVIPLRMDLSWNREHITCTKRQVLSPEG